MSTLVVSALVAAPADAVFEVYTDLEKAVDRIPEIVALELLTDGPVGVGTRWRETRLMFKKEAVEEMEITSFDRPSQYVVEANSHGSLYRTVFDFVEEDGGTRVFWTFHTTAQSFGAKIMAPIFKLLMSGMMRKLMQKELETLGAVCEQEVGASVHD
ncbi:MAG: SRPBCC family protein [Planctomycetota bacterium]